MNRKERFLMLAPVVLASPLCELVDALLQVHPCPKTPVQKSRKRLLIVRLDAIGDFVLFLDSFKEYRRLYPSPEWEITLLGNRVWSGLAERLPYADRYLFLEPRKFILHPLYRFRILKDIRRQRFDRLIEPTYSRTYFAGDAVVRASGAPERIGSAGNLSNMIGWQKRRSDRWYTRLVPASSSDMNELERNAEFLRGLGLDSFRPSPPHYPHERAADLSALSTLGITEPYVVIVPGAGVRGRQWPADHFVEIARRLYRKTGLIPVLGGGPRDVPVTGHMIGQAPDLPWISCAGTTTLLQMMSVLANARMLIANETGAIHMAAAVGCPTICIMGGGHFRRFYPYSGFNKCRLAYKPMDCFGCDWWCRYPTVRCISEITVDDVWKEVKSLMEETSR